MSETKTWATRRYKFTFTGRQANTILMALENESMDEASDHAYEKCYDSLARQLEKQGFWDSPAKD